MRVDRSPSPPYPGIRRGIALQMRDLFPDDPDLRREVLRTVIRSWEKESGNSVEVTGYGHYGRLKLALQCRHGNGPDLMMVYSSQLDFLHREDILQPVPRWVWLPEEQEGYVVAAWEACTFAGRQWGIPITVETSGLFYRRDLMDETVFAAGSQTLWSQVADALDGRHVAGASPNFYYLYAFLSGNGGYIFKRHPWGWDWNDLGIDAPESIRGVQFLRELTRGRHPTIRLPSFAQSLEDFTSGQACLFLSGPWDRANFKQVGIDVGFVPIPAIVPERPSRALASADVLAVNRYSNHRNEAFALMRYLAEHLPWSLFQAGVWLPARKDLLQNDAVQRDPVARGLAQAVLVAEAIPSGNAEMNSVWNHMSLAIADVVAGKRPPERALTRAVKRIRKDIGASAS